ncbi:MAG TPA: hypothetical protein VGB83_07355 [Actinomycetota bacterium]
MSDIPSDDRAPNGDATPDEVTPGDSSVIAPEPAAPKSRTGSWIVIAVGVAALLTVSAAVVAIRSEPPVDLAERVPSGVGAYAAVTIKPSGDERGGLQRLLDRLPAGARQDVEDGLDEALDEIAREIGLDDYATGVEPWIGSQVAVALPTLNFLEPDVIVLIAVQDEAAAKTALAGVPDSAVVVEDGVAFVGPRESTVDAFIADRADGESLAADPDFAAGRASFGEAPLFFTFADFSKLGSLPGLTAATPAGVVTAGLTADETGIALSFSGAATESASGGSLDMVESAPANVTAALSVFGVGKPLGDALEQLPFIAAMAGADPGAILGPLEDLGIDVERDLLPLLQGEVSTVFGESVFPIPELALLIDKADAGASKAAAGLVEALGDNGAEVTPINDGFRIVIDVVGLVLLENDDRIVVSTRERFARGLLRAADEPLSGDARYRAAVGPASDSTFFQLYVDLQAVRALIPTAGMTPEEIEDMTAFFDLFSAFAIHADATTARIALTTNPT